MSSESPDPLDQLLHDWATSRGATDEHTRELTERIRHRCTTLSGGVSYAVAAGEGSSTADGIGIGPGSTPALPWGGKLMIGGGGLLLCLILAGSLLWYNLARDGDNTTQRPRIASSAGTEPDTTTPPVGLPSASFLGGSILAGKQQLIAETNDVFDDRLTWIADGEREVSLSIDDREALESQFLLVRIVIAERGSSTSDWETVWQTDVIARDAALVEIAPEQLDGSSLALWAHVISDGEVAVEMNLSFATDSQFPAATNTVLRSGQPTPVSCESEDGTERCVFQTVMPLHSS